MDNIQAKTGKTLGGLLETSHQESLRETGQDRCEARRTLGMAKAGNWTRARACEPYHIISAPGR